MPGRTKIPDASPANSCKIFSIEIFLLGIIWLSAYCFFCRLRIVPCNVNFPLTAVELQKFFADAFRGTKTRF